MRFLDTDGLQILWSKIKQLVSDNIIEIIDLTDESD